MPTYELYCRLWYGLRNEWTIADVINRCRYKKEFRSLKDIHKGKRCFIIGNGPSLTASDLNMLKNEFTFAANRIFYMFDKTEWRPTYYCSQDMVVIDDIKERLSDVLPECEKMFLIRKCYNLVPEDVRKSKKALFYCVRYKTSHGNLKFCDDISYHISGGSTITYAALQIAVYMGFKDIYLIGVDNNYASSSFKDNGIGEQGVKSSYFEGMPTNIKMTKPNPDVSTFSFMTAKEYADSHGINIYNATRGGKLEVFPRKRLEEVLQDK